MRVPGFEPTTLSNEEITIELTRCDRCQRGIPKFVVVYHENDHAEVMTLCAICYSDYVDEKARLTEKLPPPEELQQEVIGIRTINEEEELPKASLVKDVSQSPPVDVEASESVGIEEKEEEKDVEPENWFKVFLKKTLQGEVPLDILNELGVLGPDKINETIMTLQTVASYPFPSVREKTVELLIHFYKNPPTKEAKNLAKAALTVFQNDTDPRVKELLSTVL